MLVSRISQPMALAASTANSTACLLSTGSAPGRPRQVGQTWVLGSPPYSLRQPQKALGCGRSWTWTSSPMTGWYLARTSGESAEIVDIIKLNSSNELSRRIIDDGGVRSPTFFL